ncbi:MAG: Gfo/Idh/MocA family oxidoreductase, partial [Clostridia bacterium]|nr:Gfo/Idh/MocA family oxidoreductase [Clostridia bacterium]
SKAYSETKKIIESGEIGRLTNVHFTYSMPPYPESKEEKDGKKIGNWRIKKETGGSMYFEKLCHYIDLVRWWNEGSRVDRFVVTSAENVIPYFEIEDNVHISYHFDNGCTSQLFFTMTNAPGYNNDLLGKDDLFDQDKQGHKLNYIITGTEGAIEIDIFHRQIRVYHHPGKPGQVGESIVRTIDCEKKDLKPGEYEQGKSEHVYFHNTWGQNQDIVHRVLEGREPSITIEDAQESMRLCLEFTKAAAESKWQVIER